ncbi:MAG TPA: flippase [Thermoplasmata archaeon]|nr:flippase [Thermoplasmata archaeon]
MNTIQRIVKNTLVLFLSKVISYLLSFLFIMYTARYLGAEGFGILSFAIAFTGIFAVFTDLGLNTLTVREVARDKSLATKYLGNIAIMKLVLVVVTFGLIALSINFLGYPKQTIKVVYLIALSVIFTSFSQMFYSIFQAYEKMEYQSMGQILSSVLILSGALFAINKNFSVVGFASIYLLVSAVVLSYSFTVCVWKFVLPKIEVDWSFWKPTIKEALPFGLTGIFVMIYYWIDSVMLSLMKGNEVVGWYNAAYRLIIIPLFIPSILNIVIFPVMSRFYISSKDAFRFTSERYFKYMAIAGFPIGVGTTLLADRIILLIFGVGYMNSIIALQILIWSSVFIFLSGAFARLLETSNRQITITKITAINASANVILNLILIPKFSYIGASITTVITEFSALMLGIIACSKIGYKISKKDLLGLSKVIIASLLMGIFIIYLKDLNLLFLILLAAVFYFTVLYVLKEFEEEDIKVFQNIISRSSEEE